MFSYKKRIAGYFFVLISLFFSLFIKAYSNSSIATENLGNDKQKSQRQISVNVDQPKPLLVHETYTYTATVTNDNGSGNTVNWHLEKDGKSVQSIPGVILKPVPQDDDDKQKGQYRATLTGSKAVSGVVVTATIGNNKSTRTPVVEFKWPTIKKPTTHLDSGSVSGDGGEAYPFTAEIFGADGTTPYTGKKIQFEWSMVHPDPSNPNNDETILSLESGSPITEVKNGTLPASLMSYQYPAVKGANVCLQVVGEDSTRQCSDKVSFKEAPLTLEMDNVVLYSTITNLGDKKYEQGQPIPELYGNGTDQYKFGVLVKRKINNNVKNGSVPYKNSQNIKEVNWGHEQINNPFHIPGLCNVQSININTDGEGYLYGTLRSYTGVENDYIRVWVNAIYLSENTMNSKADSDNYVRFKKSPNDLPNGCAHY
ncbi:inverse autotransporter beta-barrel domain-containing protein [Xenorhabdus mauleonii]|uniref:Adhesin/invasin n=1 Tax=Xenorhabdus mauleonii TaxID=351675 RepID=A0A1I3HV24_9GAMM|nr:hypothetical protein [Xenorhabdus mauleonii]PHM40264.1 inverse autotransporter beta-barrel domain-containing protein [Xenorhabdus mauleonii]SFI39473.1 adhesin/invasin [Xenorhabdus mauleonii]